MPEPTEVQDATVEPVAINDPALRAALVAAGGAPQAVPTHIARARERVRSGIAIAMVGATAAAGVAGGWATLAGSSHATAFLAGVFTPLLGVTGTVLGFYFNGKDSTS